MVIPAPVEPESVTPADFPAAAKGIPVDDYGREILTSRKWRSLWVVLLMQAQIVLSDHALRFLLIGLALAVVADTWVGKNVESLVCLWIPVPFILFAPMIGFFCDRYSKRLVLGLCFVAQLILFLWILGSLWLGSLTGVIVGFIGLSIQNAIFHPAKSGILKEIIGSRRLGMVAGWMQMILTVSILLGIFLGASWFESEYTRLGDPWRSAMPPVIVVAVLSLVPLLGVMFITPTPGHSDVRYRHSIWLGHVSDLRNMLRDRTLRLTTIGIASFWLLAGMMGLMIIGARRELAAVYGSGSGVEALALMYGSIGIGLLMGSGLVALFCRHRIELGLVLFGSAGLVIGLLWAGLANFGSPWIYASMGWMGFSAAFFLLPLNAFLQDRAPESERGRVLATANLVSHTAAIAAAVLVAAMRAMDWSISTQFLVLVVPTAVLSLYVFRLLYRRALRLVVVATTRFFYRIQRIDHNYVPNHGGLLVISNHVGFTDAFLLGVSFDRRLRFVMIEKYYRLWWARWFLDSFGAMPITPNKSKDAIRMTAAAASHGDMVCIFPEGQLTRTGLMHEFKPGFQLIARQGNVPVLPVFIDGIWGSVFTFERNRYFKKWPLQFPYPVTVVYGPPVPAREATKEWAEAAFRKLSAQAFALRSELGHSLRKQWFRALSPLRSPFGPRRGQLAIVTDDGLHLGPGKLLRLLRSFGDSTRGDASLPEMTPDLDALLSRLAVSLREDRVPGLKADARVIAAQICHFRSINLLMPDDVIRPVGDWRQPALWMLGILSPLLGGWTLWLGRSAAEGKGEPLVPEGIKGRRIMEVRVLDERRVEVRSSMPTGVGHEWAQDRGAQWPPDRVLRGLAEPETGALVALNLPEPPQPPAAVHQPSWREDSVGKLLPGITIVGNAPLRLSGVPLGGRIWTLEDQASIDDAGFLFTSPREERVSGVHKGEVTPNGSCQIIET